MLDRAKILHSSVMCNCMFFLYYVDLIICPYAYCLHEKTKILTYIVPTGSSFQIIFIFIFIYFLIKKIKMNVLTRYFLSPGGGRGPAFGKR